MKQQTTETISVSLHPTAETFMHIFNTLDTKTITDINIDYKRLYYHAFNGLSMILEDFNHTNNPVLARIILLQQELEEQFMSN